MLNKHNEECYLDFKINPRIDIKSNNFDEYLNIKGL